MSTQLKAIVVTCDTEMIRIFCAAFESLGVETESASSLTAATNPWLRSKVEAIVLDFDGLGDELSIFAELRKTPSNQNAIVIAVATHLLTRQRAFRSGAQFIVQRPLLVEQINSSVRAAHSVMIQGRRKSFRLTASLEVSVTRSSGENVECRSINLSRNGMAVHAPTSLSVGEPITLSFVAPLSQAVLIIQAVVVWDDHHGKSGVRFGQVSNHVEEHLHTWLDDECLVWHKVG